MKAKLSATLAAAIGLTALSAPPAPAAVGNFIIFTMKVSPAAAECLPNAYGRVTVVNLGSVENLHIEVARLKPKTDFDFFIIQVPNAPFGLSWYQGDIQTDAAGNGVGNFTGRFSSETFIVAPGQAIVPAPLHPEDAPAGSKNPAITAPIHLFHLGLWFDSHFDAQNAGCPINITPFNGNHEAGIQVLNTGAFPDDKGPLRSFVP
jgi:hypothetical protein